MLEFVWSQVLNTWNMKYRHKSKAQPEFSHRVTKQDVNSQLIYMFLTLEVIV
jgi:hypothetical protein